MPAGIVTRSVRLRSSAALALARVAARLDDLALAVAARAGADVDHLAEHRLADGSDLAATVALRAGDRLGAGLRAVAVAGLAASGATVNSISFSVPLTASSKVIRRS